MATVPLTIYITDDVTNGPPNNPPGQIGAPVGVNVYVYDANKSSLAQSQTGITTGSVEFSLAPGQYNVQITASGYLEYQNPVDLTEEYTLNASLNPAPLSTVSVEIGFSPNVPGALWSLTTPNSSFTGMCINQVGTVLGGPPPTGPVGSYTITATAPGYQPFTSTVQLTVANYFITVQMVKIADPGPTPVSTSPSAVNQSAVQQAILQNPLTNPSASQPEWVPPNDQYNKYYTATQARIYVGRLFIDEVNGLQFVLQDNTLPIFGYASKYFDALGNGKSMVQGQLMLNFISEGYLLTVLKNYAGFSGGNISSPSPALQSATTLTQNLKQLQGIGASDMTVTQVMNARNQALAGLGPSAIASIKASPTTPNQGKYNNAVYQSIVFDLECKFGEGSTQRTRRIEKIKLTSNEVILDQSGSPVLDTYGFIARRIL